MVKTAEQLLSQPNRKQRLGDALSFGITRRIRERKLAESRKGMEPETLPGQAFNEGTLETTPKAQVEKMKGLSGKMEKLGYSLNQLTADAQRVSSPEHMNRQEAQEVVGQLHDAAAMLFGQWALSHDLKDRNTEYAAARLFNRLTSAARKVDGRHDLFDKVHRELLVEAVRYDSMRNVASGLPYNPDFLAQAMNEAAQARTHETAWAWVVLPTFPNQHYGRILLDAIDIPNAPFKVFVTQPTFTNGEATLFHTHGQNWAFSRPLGKSGENKHINTLWEPNSREELFPLRQLPPEKGGKAYYKAGEVAVIAPKTIHGIAGARENQIRISLDEVAKLPPSQQKDLIGKIRFGEQSALHIYKADAQLAEEFIDNPVVLQPGQPDRDFFERNDMIVFNHQQRRAWAGGGGAWEQRMLQHGPTGEHCGMCFAEDDPRQRDLPAAVVYDRFVDPSSPPLIQYRYDQNVA